MIKSGDLLDQARTLLGTKKGAPRQADLRRAVASAHYAVFHHLVRSCADHIAGKSRRKTAEYRLVYRSFQHSHLRSICDEAKKTSLPARLTTACGLGSFGTELRECAELFITLQDTRHAADYDPQERFSKLLAEQLITDAVTAILRFEAAPEQERRALIYLFSFRLRQ